MPVNETDAKPDDDEELPAETDDDETAEANPRRASEPEDSGG